MKKLFFLAVFSVVFIACKKDKGGDDAPPANVYGYWTGSWKLKTNSKENELAVVLRNNGTVRILTGYVGGDTARAIYVSEDHYTYEEGVITFESRETNFKYSYKGEVRGKSMSGTWGEIPSYDNGGTWKMGLKQ